MRSHALPLVLAALLTGAGGGAATWALAADDTPTQRGNEAPLDDNHRGTTPAPTPSADRSARPATVTVRATAEPTEDRTHEPEPTEVRTHEPEPTEDRTHEPEPADDHGTEAEPGDDRGTHVEPSDDRGTQAGDDSGDSGDSGRGGDDDRSGRGGRGGLDDGGGHG